MKRNCKSKDELYFHILFFFSILITFVLMIEIVDVSMQLKSVLKVKKESQYLIDQSVVIDLGFKSTEEINELEEASAFIEKEYKGIYEEYSKFNEITDAVILTSVEATYAQSKLPGVIYVVLSSAQLKYPLETGSFQNEIGTVVIGTGLKKFQYEKDNKQYIQLNGNEYLVTGILSDICGDKSDDRIYCHLNGLYQEELEVLLFQYATFVPSTMYVYSDYADIEQVNETISFFLENNKNMDAYHFYENSHMYGDDNIYIKIITCMLIFMSLFCIYNCIKMSKLWMERYRKDLIIMKAFGLSISSILIYFYKDIFISYGILTLIVFGFKKDFLVFFLGVVMLLVCIAITLEFIYEMLFVNSVHNLDQRIV